MKLADDKWPTDDLATATGMVHGVLTSSVLWAIISLCLWSIFIWILL